MTIEEYNQSVQLYSDALFRFLLKSIKDRETAKDLVQETFEKLWLCIENTPYEKAKSFLFTVGYRKLIDAIRKSRYLYIEEGGEKYDAEMFDPEYNNLKDILDIALNKLPEIQRSLVLLKDYEAYSYKEIAEITGLTDAQVKVYLFRARKFLKEYLISIQKVQSL